MDDEGNSLVHTEGLEQGVKVAAVLDEPIRAGATVRQLVGVAHANQVGGDAAASWLQVRQHVTPEIRRGGVAVQQHDGVALSHLHVRHFAAEDPPPPLLVRKCWGDHARLSCGKPTRSKAYAAGPGWDIAMPATPAAACCLERLTCISFHVLRSCPRQ